MSLDNDSIIELLDRMESDTKALKKEIFKLCWYMRGGISLDEMFQLGNKDREIVQDIVKENLEVTKETSLPFF